MPPWPEVASCTALPKSVSLPQNPASGGMPASENMKTAIAPATSGCERARPASSSTPLDFAAGRAEIGERGERAHRGQGIDQRRRTASPSMPPPDAIHRARRRRRGRGREADQQVAAVGDRRIGHQPADVLLPQGADVADRHRQDRPARAQVARRTRQSPASRRRPAGRGPRRRRSSARRPSRPALALVVP